MCETLCCNDPPTYFFNLLFLGLQAIKSVKVENVSGRSQIDSMLLCICALIDHRLCQNLRRTKTWPVNG